MKKSILMTVALLCFLAQGAWAQTTYAINTDIFGEGTVTVKNGENEVTSAVAGTVLTVILEAGEGNIVYGANIDSVSIDYSTFERQTEAYWKGTITMPESEITIKPDFVKPYARLTVNPYDGKFTYSYDHVVESRYGEVGVEIEAEVTLTVKPHKGYAIESVSGESLIPGISPDLELTHNNDSTWSFTMPDRNVSVFVSCYKTSGTYDINIGEVVGTLQFMNSDGDLIKKADEGEKVTVIATPAYTEGQSLILNDAYTIVTVTDAVGNTIEVTRESSYYGGESISFIMPASSVTVSAEFKNTINVDAQNGTCAITVEGETRSYAEEGDTVTCTLKPDEGYVLADLLVFSRNFTSPEIVNIPCTKTGEDTYTFTMPNSNVIVSPVFATPLADDKDNTDAIAALKDNYYYYSTVMLSGRTLYKDGSWNTICLPFDMDKEFIPYWTTIFTDATVMELDTVTSGFNSNTGTLTLNFTEVEDELEAGKPYIVKWENGENIVDPYFMEVKVSATEPETVTTVDGTASFVGTFAPAALTANTTANLYLGADNKLYYPTVSDFKVNAFRAYFTVDLDPDSQVRAFMLNFGDESTAIRSLSTDSMDSKDKAAWHTLDGRRLAGKPSQSGIYINNGKAVVIK